MVLMIASLILTLLLPGCRGGGGVAQPTTYNVSGQVVDSANAGVAGVSLVYTGGASGTVTTAANGTWTMTGLKGSVTITPSRSGWTFSPTNKVVTGALQGIKFTGTPVKYTITTTCSGQGSIVKDPSLSEYSHGQSVQLTATAGSGWSFSHWEGSLTGINNPTTFIVDGNKSVSAVFIPDECVLTIDAVGSGSISKSPDQTKYQYGDSVVIEATPAEGWSFGGWSGDLGGSQNPTTIQLNGNKSITATFLQMFSLTTTTEGQGSLSRSVDQPLYTDGSSVTLTATPVAGWYFDHWEGDLTDSQNPANITINGSKNVKAVFKECKYALSVSNTGNGTVTKDPDQITYLHGVTVELTATPDAGWEFDHWEGDLTGTNNPTSIVLNDDKSVTAVFTFSIQAAIDAAQNGDVIIVPTGTYYENLDFKGKAITVKSTNPQDPNTVSSTIIDGGFSGPVVTFRTGESASSVLSGVTLTNGTGRVIDGKSAGGGIFISGASPIISHSVISGNQAELGGGIYINDASPTLTNNTIENNQGFGIEVYDSPSSLLIEDNEITYNSGGIRLQSSSPQIANNLIDSNNGVGIHIHWYSSPTIDHNTISNNYSRGIGFGWSGCSPTITNNTIEGNNGGMLIDDNGISGTIAGNTFRANIRPSSGWSELDYSGGGICIGYSGIILISGNTFEDNQAGNGGAIYLGYYTGSKVTLQDNVFESNTAVLNGGAIYARRSSSQISGNSFDGNIATNGGGLYATENSNIYLSSNSFNNNTANQHGGAVYVSFSSSVSQSSNTFTGNSPDSVYTE